MEEKKKIQKEIANQLLILLLVALVSVYASWNHLVWLLVVAAVFVPGMITHIEKRIGILVNWNE